MGRNGKKRPLSAGTWIMLVMLAVVIAGSALVLGRLSSGASVDLSKLNMNLLNLGQTEGGTNDTPYTQTASPAGASAVYPGRERKAETNGTQGPEGTPEAGNTQAPAATAVPAPLDTAAAETDGQPAEEERSFTLAAAGVLCLDSEVRKNSWNSEAKAYDYTDMLLLLKGELHGDVNTVFLENLLMESDKYTDTVAPESAADLLREAGFTTVACGWAQARSKGAEGIGATRMALEERNLQPIGIRNDDDQEAPGIVNVKGIRTAFLQYTGTVAAKTRKSMEKDGTQLTVPEAEAGLIAREVSAARANGAEAVIVLINWGKTGKNQRAIAEAAAAAGADLIIGGGSRAPEGAEYLTGADGGKVLCVWNPGSLLTGDRANVKRMSGYLLHAEIRSNGRGGVNVLAPEYTPVYTWKYKQDGRFYYRCVASDREAPDGMNDEQKKTMAKSKTAVDEALANSPLTIRETE